VRIFNPINLGGLQTFSVVLKRMLEDGVTDVAEAKVLVDNAIRERHTDKSVDNTVPPPQTQCTEPSCGGVFLMYRREDLDGTMVTILKCDKCQYSKISVEKV